MKAKITIATLLFSILIHFYPSDIKAEQQTIEFPVLGNCYLCKLRIEEAVNQLNGIDTVVWDYLTKVTTVTYDDQLCDAYAMMTAIANVGHDTEWYPAPDSAYHTLIGTCCEYLRTNDYTNVQVGYLSLMDLWVYPLSIKEVYETIELKIFPSIGNGIFNFELDKSQNYTDLQLTVYAISGTKVFNKSLGNQSSGKIDLQSMPAGNYVIIVTDSNTPIARSKLIKN